MNDRMPTSVTSPANQSASSERGIDRLFGELEALYGSRFADMWAGTDIERVKAKWTEKLRGFADHPGVIQKAVDALDERPSPPTLPEFMALCRDAARRMGSTQAALPHKMTAADHERVAQAARDAKRAVERAGMDKVEFWATHPRSHHHLRFILDAAKNDHSFEKHVETMVNSGVCTAEGHALKLYRDGSWVPAQRQAA